MTYSYIDIMQIYEGSNGDATKALYAALERDCGIAGFVAVNVFRATKSSARAKVYRGGGYKGMAYDRKNWSLDNLCRSLAVNAQSLGIRWGWGRDTESVGFEHVLYIDLPTGQVSFHTDRRSDGPDYPDKWDGVRRMGPDRICRWCANLLAAPIRVSADTKRSLDHEAGAP